MKIDFTRADVEALLNLMSRVSLQADSWETGARIAKKLKAAAAKFPPRPANK